MYPPVPEKLEDLFQLGFKDTENWLKEHRHRLRVPQPMHNGTQHGAHQASKVPGSMFGQFACQAPSCDESLKEVAVGKLIKMLKQSRHSRAATYMRNARSLCKAYMIVVHLDALVSEPKSIL